MGTILTHYFITYLMRALEQCIEIITTFVSHIHSTAPYISTHSVT